MTVEISNFEDTNFLGFQHGCPVFLDYVDVDDTDECVLAVLTKVHADGSILCAANCMENFSTGVQTLRLEAMIV